MKETGAGRLIYDVCRYYPPLCAYFTDREEVALVGVLAVCNSEIFIGILAPSMFSISVVGGCPGGFVMVSSQMH